MIDVRLVSMTSVNWDALIGFCVRNHDGKSPTKKLDQKSISLSDPRAYRIVLNEMANNISDVALDFVHLTFAIKMDDFYFFDNLVLLPNIKVNDSRFVTGTVKQFKDIIISGCTTKVDEDTRRVFDSMWVILDQLKYSDLFPARKTQIDGTFTLC